MSNPKNVNPFLILYIYNVVMPKYTYVIFPSYSYIYINAFSRRFYPKWLTVHSGYTCYCQYMCSLGIEPTTFVLLTQCSTTEPHRNTFWILFNKIYIFFKSVTLALKSHIETRILQQLEMFWLSGQLVITKSPVALHWWVLHRKDPLLSVSIH